MLIHKKPTATRALFKPPQFINRLNQPVIGFFLLQTIVASVFNEQLLPLFLFILNQTSQTCRIMSSSQDGDFP